MFSEKLSSKKKLLIYVCGPTLYRQAHIGNLRTVVFFSSFVNLLNILGIKYRYVSNVTDIGHENNEGEDKILSQLEKEEYYELVHEYWSKYIYDLNSINLNLPEFYNASDFVTEQLEIIENSFKNNACVENDKGVYFNQNITIPSDMFLDGGKRIQSFAFWKKIKEKNLFSSPYGNGLPGWHIECYSIIKYLFGNKTIDIHAGGIDLRDIHHNCEILHKYCDSFSSDKLANNWLHFGNLLVDNEKMSKSLNNSINLSYFHENYSLTFFKFLILSYSNSSDINISTSNLNSLWQKYTSLVDFLIHCFMEKFSDLNLFDLIKNISAYKCNDFSSLKIFIEEAVDNFNLNLLVNKILSSSILDEILILDNSLKIGIKEEIVKILSTGCKYYYIMSKRSHFRKLNDFSKADDIRNKIIKDGYKVIDSGNVSICYKI